MYEEFFGMTRRPFSANPNAAEFTAIGPIQEALESVLNCLTHSRGAAVVTGATGMGKTAFCRHVAHILRETHRAVYPTASSLETRRAFLQSILYELGADYVGLDEEDARLRLFAAAQESKRLGKTLLLVIDDAHLLHGRLLDELRTLTDYAPTGEVLFRIVLCGQFALEEMLADPAHASFSQRIGAHVCLETYSLEQSARFLIDRLRSSGVEDLAGVVTSDAMEQICRAADGNLRCLCQLADHALLMAFAQERRPVTAETVLAALDGLKDLPLPWGEVSHPDETPLAVDAPVAEKASMATTDSLTAPFLAASSLEYGSEIGGNSPTDSIETAESTEAVEYAVIEVGAESAWSPPPPWQPSGETGHVTGGDRPRGPSFSAVAIHSPPIVVDGIADCEPFSLEEIPVLDRYAALDRLAELPEEKWGEVRIPAREIAPSASSTSSIDDCCADSIERGILVAVQETLQEIRDLDRKPQDENLSSARSGTDTESAETAPSPPDLDPATVPRRRFALLFTRLQERRRKSAASAGESHQGGNG